MTRFLPARGRILAGAAVLALMTSGCVIAIGDQQVERVKLSESRNIEAGPIWNQADAELKCPVVAYAVGGRWNGQWSTTIPSEMSVCSIDPK